MHRYAHNSAIHYFKNLHKFIFKFYKFKLSKYKLKYKWELNIQIKDKYYY